MMIEMNMERARVSACVPIMFGGFFMKHYKQIIFSALSLCLALGVCGVATACGGEKQTTVDYSVTVTCDDSAVLDDVKVELTNENGITVEGCAAKALTAGKATFEAAPGTYQVELSGVPEEYTWEPATVSEAKPDVTVALTLADTEENVAFTITVVNDKDEPVEGAEIQICSVGDEGGSCFGGDTTKTDAQGKVTIEAPEATYEVHILSGVPEGYVYDNEVDGPKNLLTAEKTEITVKLLPTPDGTLANPYLFASPFAGAQTVKLPAYADDEGTAYVYYSYTATETAIYTLTYEDSYIVDVNIAKDGDHLHPIALWNIKAESYPFQLKAGETYSFRFADFRAEAVGGDLPITIAKTALTIPAAYAGTWTDLAEDPTHTVVLTKNGDAWTVTYNGTAVELGLADTNGGYLFTLGGKDYTMSFPENGASLLLAWGTGEDESVFLFTEGNHPDRSPGTEGNPIPLTQDELTTRTWSEDTTIEGKFFTVTVTETKMYELTVTTVSTANCEAMISIEDETGHNVLSEWMGAVNATVKFRLDEGKIYTINVGIADPTDETGMTSPSGTVAFTLAEIDLAEIPQEILDINWVCTSGAATITLTKYTVTVNGEFPFSGDVTAVSTEGDTTTITWGASGHTLVYNSAEKTLAATIGINSYSFTAKEESGTITLPTGWNGTYKSGDNVVVINGSTITITFNGYTNLSVTVTGYDETTETITFEAEGVTGTLKNAWSWQKATSDDGVGALNITLNGANLAGLRKQ